MGSILLYLRIISGPSKGDRVSLTPENLPLTIGRDAGNRLQLEHTAISRCHCVRVRRGRRVLRRGPRQHERDLPQRPRV